MEIETLYLGRQEISPCRGCRVCFDRGEDKCPLKDDLLLGKEKMKQADGILFASPVYVDDVSGDESPLATKKRENRSKILPGYP